MNTVLDHDGHVPSLCGHKQGQNPRKPHGEKPFPCPKGSIVTFDKGYINYSWFRLLGEKSIFFVTRPQGTTPFTS